MNATNMVIVTNRLCTDIYDFSIAEYADIVTLDLTDMEMEEKYVHAVDHHADLFVDDDQDTVDYFIENGISAMRLR